MFQVKNVYFCRVWKEITLNASSDEVQYQVWDYPVREQYGHILLAINSSNPLPNTEEGFRKVDERLEADFAFIHDSSEIKWVLAYFLILTHRKKSNSFPFGFWERRRGIFWKRICEGWVKSCVYLSIQMESLENTRKFLWKISSICSSVYSRELIQQDTIGRSTLQFKTLQVYHPACSPFSHSHTT